MHGHPILAAAALSVLAAAAAAQVAPAGDPPGPRCFGAGGARVRIGGDGTAAVSRDGGRSFVALPASKPLLRLRRGAADPLQQGPGLPAALTAPRGSRLFLVQSRTALLPEYRQVLVDAGLEVVAFVPDQAYLVRGDRAARAGLRARPWVRWVGDFALGDKLDPRLQALVAAALPAPAADYEVVLSRKGDRAAVAVTVAGLGGSVTDAGSGSPLLRARLTPDQLAALAAADTVLWIEPSTPVGVDVDNARIQGGANYVEALGGYAGQGVRVEITEGLDNSHPDWSLPPLVRYDGLESHGHCTAAIIADDGAGLAQARGILPQAQLIESSVFNWLFAGVSRWSLIQDSVNPALPWQAMQQTASWGSTQTTTYTAISQELDDALFTFDLATTQSMSNTGTPNARPQAWAKNVLAVGSVWHFDNSDPSDDTWTDASIGPAADGRIKPDLVAYGEAVLCGDITGAGGYSPTDYFTSFSGTSAATPIVNGYLGLAQQMFTDGLFHNPLPLPATAGNRFANKPHMSTAKALLLNTAAAYAFSGTADNLTRTHQGWGFPDVARLFAYRNRIVVRDEYDVLAQGEEHSQLVWIRPGTAAFRATMTYADPAGVPNATLNRVNDLDLRVSTVDGGTEWWGNHGLDVGNASTLGGGPDDRDTVEQVWLQNPVPGIYRVTVSAPTIVQDGHVETPQLDADYALVMHPVGGGYHDRDGMTLDLLSAAPGDLRVQLANVPATGWSEGYTFCSFATAGRPGFGSFFGLEPDFISAAIYQLPAVAGDVFHFTNAGAGSFPFAPFAFPAPLALALHGLQVDALVTLLGPGSAIAEQSNVARVTIQ